MSLSIPACGSQLMDYQNKLMDCSKEEEKAYNLLLENYSPSPDIASFAPRFKAGYIVTAIYLAMVDKNEAALRCLLSSGVDITVKRSTDSNIYKPVLPVDIDEQISLLLSPSCAYTHQDKIYKLSALDFAVSVGNIPMARLLIEKGFDDNETARVMSFNNPRPYDDSPLHRAVKDNDINMVKFLLNNGADVDITGGCGRTPLYYAHFHNFPTILDELLLRGANKHIKLDNYGNWMDVTLKPLETPLKELRLGKIPKIVKPVRHTKK